MDGLLKQIGASSDGILAVLIALTVVLLLWCILLQLRLNGMRQKWRQLFESADADGIERLLLDHLRERVLQDQRLDAIDERLAMIEQRFPSTKRYMGLVRYDAFEDVGGSQSFSLAVYDEEGNGAVLTSLVGRADCRVFCKQLVNGRSERNLSTEERQAVESASTGRAQPRISP